ncbi:hypothetical protein U1Q18_052152 [Sarracenia purpurea var. burkii]
MRNRTVMTRSKIEDANMARCKTEKQRKSNRKFPSLASRYDEGKKKGEQKEKEAKRDDATPRRRRYRVTRRIIRQTIYYSMCQCVNVLVVRVRCAFENSVKEQRTPINCDAVDDDDDDDNNDNERTSRPPRPRDLRLFNGVETEVVFLGCAASSSSCP